MGRLRYTSVSGFPRVWLTTRMPYSGHSSPLVTPDVQISRIRRSQILLVAGIRKEVTVHLDRQQAQLNQVLIPGDSFRTTEGPLAPPAQMPDQTRCRLSHWMSSGIGMKHILGLMMCRS
jgi:hypothetical protein